MGSFFNLVYIFPISYYNGYGDRMLISAKEMVNKAKREGYAVPHFNINNLEWTRFILEECEEKRSPVILGVSESAVAYMGGYDVVTSIVLSLLKDLNITIPVSLHLDHGKSPSSCKHAIDAGFTSVMIDASLDELEENIQKTIEVVEYAKDKNVSVEAEVGAVGTEEEGVARESMYAKVEDCLTFVLKTHTHLLAPALGSVHGIYKGEPKLDFERMKEISVQTKLPLVLHGGTGIPDDMIEKAIICGVHKININTELQMAWSASVRTFLFENKEVYDPRKIMKAGECAMKEKIAAKITLLGSMNRA